MSFWGVLGQWKVRSVFNRAFIFVASQVNKKFVLIN